jgi:D-glycero-alpha-D-manno-heptose 1-phosphate guanylyltransferase
MIKEAIILAGGFGTRLKSVVGELPKPMALINDRPFLEYQLSFLDSWGINHVVLSLGYKAEIIQKYFGEKYKNIDLTYSIEKEPLGTGGAVKMAFSKINGSSAFVLNGDTLFDVNLKRLTDCMRIRQSDFCMALRFSTDSNRYGSVEMDKNFRITNFLEKAKDENDNFINGGIYGIRKEYFLNLNLPEKFSLETDFLEKYYNKEFIYGFKCHSFFIDIGIPEDYERAQDEFKSLPY